MHSIWEMTFGQPEEKTPLSVLERTPRTDELDGLSVVEDCPILPESIHFQRTARGCTITFPAQVGEQFYGGGLQLKSVNQTGRKKMLRVNSDPSTDIGDSHAPVPFFLSDRGYGVYIDTARYITVYFASHTQTMSNTVREGTIDSVDELYAADSSRFAGDVIIDIPAAAGVRLFIFGGPDMRTALQRYNLFSGGGAVPPLWGLGIWYRDYVRANTEDVLNQVQRFRKDGLPCDVLGLEPGWQTRSYSCSYRWNPENFPNPDKMMQDLAEYGVRVNLWEHIFVNPEAEMHRALEPYSGDYLVWNGLVPDFTIDEAVKVYKEHHTRELLDRGVAGFKLDECDGSDYIQSPWSFPEASMFPSGLDGEQMHCLLGALYMRANQACFLDKGKRTYGCVRSAGALAAPDPYVLYSDLYDMRDYARGMLSAGYCGLLWSPEVRQCASEADLIRRLQMVALSPMALINAWMIPNPPWLQWDEKKNHAGEFLENSEELTALCRKIFQLRMSLVPYLYAAFCRYQKTGIPPFRALPLDYPTDPCVRNIEDCYMIGEDLLFAVTFPDQSKREVYLPEGEWYHFFTGKQYKGGESYSFDTADYEMLLFVRSGALLPLAAPVESISETTVFDITLCKYGEGNATCTLFEDDGETLEYAHCQTAMTVVWEEGKVPTTTRVGNYPVQRYRVTGYRQDGREVSF